MRNICLCVAFGLWVMGSGCKREAVEVPPPLEELKSEADSNLRALLTAEVKYQARHGVFLEDLAQLGFTPSCPKKGGSVELALGAHRARSCHYQFDVRIGPAADGSELTVVVTGEGAARAFNQETTLNAARPKSLAADD